MFSVGFFYLFFLSVLPQNFFVESQLVNHYVDVVQNSTIVDFHVKVHVNNSPQSSVQFLFLVCGLVVNCEPRSGPSLCGPSPHAMSL